MAQASSAQREPSMEEILASIRRIIEDSDQGKKPEPEQHLRFEAPGERGEGAVIEVDAFRAELRGRADQHQDHAMPDPAPKDDTESLAPVGVPARHVPEATAASQTGPVDLAADMGSPAQRGPLPTDAQNADYLSMPKDAGHQVSEPVSAAATQEPYPQELSYQAQRPAIISEQAGRQVAAAFGELSEVFAASRRKSFDEMAEEMLRPMLQDWLDNNLPVLVERLVREEIERVARGG